MRVIEITMEKRLHTAMQAIVTEKEWEQIKNGESPLLEKMKRELDSGNGYPEYEYAVADKRGNTIFDWTAY